MRFSNKDVIGFYYEPPDIRGARKLSQAAKDAAEELFNEKNTYRPMAGFERGWIYGYINAGDLAGFVAIGRDSKQSRFFHELRLDDKNYLIGEQLCETKTIDSQKIVIREKGLSVDWHGKPPEQNITIKIEAGDAKAEFRYHFEKFSEKVGPYRAVVDVFGNRAAYFFFTPAKATLTVKVEGDCEKLGIAKELCERVNGREITSFFAYNECVRMNNPMISEGWDWHIVGCYQDNPSKPEKIAGYMDLYFESEKFKGLEKILFNQQIYAIDLESGNMDMYTDAEVSSKTIEGKPSFHAKTDDDEMELELTAKNAPVYRKISDKAGPLGIHLHNIDYCAFAPVGTAKIHGKDYNATGTSEMAGGKGQRWI